MSGAETLAFFKGPTEEPFDVIWDPYKDVPQLAPDRVLLDSLVKLFGYQWNKSFWKLQDRHRAHWKDYMPQLVLELFESLEMLQ